MVAGNDIKVIGRIEPTGFLPINLVFSATVIKLDGGFDTAGVGGVERQWDKLSPSYLASIIYMEREWDQSDSLVGTIHY